MRRTDDELLAGVANGDATALAELFDRHGRVAYGLALRVVRDADLAEDVVQEAFLSVWRSAHAFDPRRSSGRSWLLVLVHRRAVDVVRFRARRAAERLPEGDGAAATPAAEAAELAWERSRVTSALAQLPERERRVLELAYYGGLTQAQIAARLGVALGTVKSRTFSALVRLRRLLEEGASPERLTALS